MQQLPLTQEQLALFPGEASTLHRLLGAQPGSQRLRYHAGNPLHLDVLVVDEASMIDLTMMSRLIDALPPHARVVFRAIATSSPPWKPGRYWGYLYLRQLRLYRRAGAGACPPDRLLA